MRAWIVVLILVCRVSLGAFTFTTPKLRQVVQRNVFNNCTLTILGPTTGVTATAQAVPIATYSGTDTGLVTIPVTGGNVTGSMVVAAGWYSLEVITKNGGGGTVDDVTLAKVGCGDVFITAGQSNATNYYTPLVVTAPNDAVNAANFSNVWVNAVDPQPEGDSDKSSAWPVVGDSWFALTTFPVGFLSIGVGNTYISSWVPGATNYTRVKNAVQMFPKFGFRSIIWMHGENDAASGTTNAAYTAAFHLIVDQSRVDAGWDVVWLIAHETHPYEAVAPVGVGPAQTGLAGLYKILAGPDADSLGSSYRAVDNVHFNTTTGRAAIAGLIYDKLVLQPFVQPGAATVIDTTNNKLCFFTGTWKCVTGL